MTMNSLSWQIRPLFFFIRNAGRLFNSKCLFEFHCIRPSQSNSSKQPLDWRDWISTERKSILNFVDKDVSNHYIDVITAEFEAAATLIEATKATLKKTDMTPTWQGMQTIASIQEHYGIENLNLIKPGVGETTRVLLRRLPWKIFVKDLNDSRLKHIFQLAKERDVPVEVYEQMTYTCCGLIKPLERKV